MLLGIGFPSVFITISPSEWSFPLPPWLKQIQESTGLGQTNLAAFETFHFVNTLEQLVRGYLCGSNDKSWTSHLFANSRNSAIQNVVNYFYRFEFQKRGTVHIRILVWLKNLKQVNVKPIRADIPWADIDSAYLVFNLQKSDKDSLPMNGDDTKVDSHNGVSSISISHPAEAFAENTRAYISTILPALECRMDVQSSDGHGLLLKYVSSYVTKAHDAYHPHCLYDVHTTPYQAAYRHLKEMAPLEPEMWLSLSSKKIAWTPHRLKKFSVPLPQTVENNKLVNTYWANVKEVLKAFVSDNPDLHKLMENAFMVSSNMFTLSTNFLVARALFRNPEKYAAAADFLEGVGDEFVTSPGMVKLKSMFRNVCLGKAKQSISHMFLNK